MAKLSAGEKLRRKLARQGINTQGAMSLNERITARGEAQKAAGGRSKGATGTTSNYIGDFLRKSDKTQKRSTSTQKEHDRYLARKAAGYSNF
jgi:hypothetical protein